ncbi:MAG: MFS transporter [Peptostreptococcaceae bacterium]|nr:MFS transporter [Peptostreptococcaceae bacterium]
MKLKFRTKLSYGIGGVADNAMFNFAASFLLFFLTIIVGIEPITAGFIAALGASWEAVCGPIIGYLSDNTNSKYGKRKPFLMIAAAPVALSTGLLFTAIDMPYSLKVIYYGVLVMVFWTTFAVFFVPYMAWGSDLTEEYNERTVIRSYTYVFYQVGMGIGIVMPTIIVHYLTEMGKTAAVAWSYVGLFVGLCAAGSLLICTLTIHESDNPSFIKTKRERLLTSSKIKEMFKSYFVILKLKAIRYLILSSILFLVSNIVFSSGRIYYYTYNLGLKGTQVSIILLIITVSGIAFVPFINAFSKRFDKNSVFFFGQIITGAIFIAFRFIGVNSYVVAIIMGIVFSIANSCYWQLMPSMLYDVCGLEELVSGGKHSGSVISLQALSESLASAIGLQLLGIILQTSGFNSAEKIQSAEALYGVSNSFTIVPGILMILVAIIIIKYPINRVTFKKIMVSLEKRRNGEQIDLDEFKDII